MEEKLAASGKTVLSGADAFKLYDTFGFPSDLTREILAEKGFTYDEEEFASCMKVQQETARSARATTNYMGADATVYDLIDPSVTSEFVGYFDHLEETSEISVIAGEKELKDSLAEGERGTIIVDRTPFYGTMGGQTGDVGTITSKHGTFRVEDTIHLRGGRIGHIGTMVSGMLEKGETVTLSVDREARMATARNHSATHLLQKALKTVIGSHVEQKGSFVSPTRLRFDFAHFQAMTPEEIRKVEDLVNDEIRAALPVKTELMPIAEARATGAMALFDEKYGDVVRVVSMGDFSKELCGGTHVSNTSEIQFFKILSDSGISSGVRRIEALTGNNLIRHYEEQEKMLFEAAHVLKTEPSEVSARISHLLSEIKDLQSENEKLKNKLANESLGDVTDRVQEVGGVKLLAAAIPDVDGGELRSLGDQLKEKIGEGVVLLASAKGGKVSLVAMVTDAAQKKGAHAGNLVRAAAKIVGGGGGGRPNMAQAGGKNPDAIPELIEKVPELLAEQLK